MPIRQHISAKWRPESPVNNFPGHTQGLHNDPVEPEEESTAAPEQELNLKHKEKSEFPQKQSNKQMKKQGSQQYLPPNEENLPAASQSLRLAAQDTQPTEIPVQLNHEANITSSPNSESFLAKAMKPTWSFGELDQRDRGNKEVQEPSQGVSSPTDNHTEPLQAPGLNGMEQQEIPPSPSFASDQSPHREEATLSKEIVSSVEQEESLQLVHPNISKSKEKSQTQDPSPAPVSLHDKPEDTLEANDSESLSSGNPELESQTRVEETEADEMEEIPLDDKQLTINNTKGLKYKSPTDDTFSLNSPWQRDSVNYSPSSDQGHKRQGQTPKHITTRGNNKDSAKLLHDSRSKSPAQSIPNEDQTNLRWSSGMVNLLRSGFGATAKTIRRAPFLSLATLTFLGIVIEGNRQLGELLILSTSSASTSTASPAKRDLAPDLTITEQLKDGPLKNLNFSTNGLFGLINLWNVLCIFVLLCLYNLTLSSAQRSKSPRPAGSESWHQRVQTFDKMVKQAGKTILSTIFMGQELHGPLHLLRTSSIHTYICLGLFITILFGSLLLTRQLLAIISISSAGSVVSSTAGRDTSLDSSTLKIIATTLSPGQIFLLLNIVLIIFIPTLLWAWHSMLYAASSSPSVVSIIGKVKSINLDPIKKHPSTLKLLKLSAAVIITSSFLGIFYFFSDLSAYASSHGQASNSDSMLNLILANVILMVFILPMVWSLLVMWEVGKGIWWYLWGRRDM